MIDNIFDGSRSDEELIQCFDDWYKGNPDIDRTKFAENFETLRLPKIKAYLENLKQSNPYLADNPKVLENLIETTTRVCGSDKKKQMMN